MKKVFLFAALVLACTAGSNASAMNEAALNASNSELMPVKKSTKKTTKKSTKKTTKKTSSKKTTAKKSTASASTASAAPTTTSSSAASAATTTTANNTSATVNSAATVAGVLGAILGGSNAGNGSNSSSNAGSIINGILNNVIGSGTFKQADLCHTWKYSKPGCAFTSENLLAKAGGEIAASKVENKLEGYYKKFGFSSSNTYFTFNTDGTFSAKIDGKNSATLEIVNDYGSEDLTATLTYNPEDGSYVLKQKSGSRIKIVVNRKWVKIPTELKLVPCK